jgi:hypothetical protein
LSRRDLTGETVSTPCRKIHPFPQLEPEELEDPLLKLLRTGSLLPKEQFLVDLENQRLPAPERHTVN